MGAWGVGPLENDDALDLIGDLEDSERPLSDELVRVLDPESLRRPTESLRRPTLWAKLLRRQPEDKPDEVNDFTVVAATAVVAAALGLDVHSVQVNELLARRPLQVSADLRTTAKAALARATSPDSEWFELWEESGELDQTQAEIDRIRQIL